MVLAPKRPSIRQTLLYDYWAWLRAEYFVEHLLGDKATSIDIVELNREQAMDGKPKGKKDKNGK